MNINRPYTLHEHFRVSPKSSHWDLRILSWNKKFVWSWAIPKKRFPKRGEKVLAIKTPDHPLSSLTDKGKLKNGDTLKILEKSNCDILINKDTNFFILFNGTEINGKYLFININSKDNWLIIGK